MSDAHLNALNALLSAAAAQQNQQLLLLQQQLQQQQQQTNSWVNIYFMLKPSRTLLGS